MAASATFSGRSAVYGGIPEYMLVIHRKQSESDAAYKRRYKIVSNAVARVAETIQRAFLKQAEGLGQVSVAQFDRMYELIHRICEKTCSLPGCKKGVYEDGTILRKCSRCQKAMYCGQDHQRDHWKLGHKQVCSLPIAEKKD